uniref:Peptidase M10 metallopeptidase domain-containing protein n=1 Tax=Acrobeloides nanus TaxID=290746 RepID=A0A914C4P6_9BILA
MHSYHSSIINIEFSETNDTNADIVIGFKRKDHNDSISFDGRGGQIAHCIGEMPCTTIHFDMDEKWRYVQMNKWL